jgi:hypothetical protein
MKESEQRPKTTRRSFLRRLGGVAVAPYIIPAGSFGADGNTAPSNKITVGLIAAGGQARSLLGNAIRHPDVKVVAVCDLNQKTLESAKNWIDDFYGNKDCSAYHDFREVIARKDIDAVIIAPPDHWHSIPCILAAQAGKDIYCEKPLTHTLAEGRAVVDAVKKAGIVFQVGSMQRSMDCFKKACELVRNGYIGKVQHINVGLPNGGHSEFAEEFPSPPPELDYDFYVGPALWTPYHPKRLDWNWRWWMGFGGGQLMDWIGHHGDIAHMGMDWDNTGPRTIEPKIWEVPAHSNLYDGPVRYMYECEYEGGVTMTLGSMDDMPEIYRKCGDTGTQWFGEDGQWIFACRGGLKANPSSLLDIAMSGDDFRFRKESNHIWDFIDCVKTRKQPIAPVDAGHRSASLGHLGTIACILGRKLQWDPAAENFVGDDVANGMLSRPCRGEWSL